MIGGVIFHSCCTHTLLADVKVVAVLTAIPNAANLSVTHIATRSLVKKLKRVIIENIRKVRKQKKQKDMKRQRRAF